MARANVKKTAKPGIVDQMAKLSIAAIAVILVVIMLVMGGVFYGLVYMPYNKDITRLQAAINTANNAISTEKASLQKHQAVGAYDEPIAAAYQYIQRYLPQEDEMPRLVQMLSEIASRAGLTDGVTRFVPRLPMVIQDNYAELPFSITLEGEFLTVLSFLYDFSRMDRIVNVTEVAIGSPKMVDERREIFHVQAICSGSIYRSLTDEEIKAGAAGAAGGKKRL